MDLATQLLFLYVRIVQTNEAVVGCLHDPVSYERIGQVIRDFCLGKYTSCIAW